MANLHRFKKHSDELKKDQNKSTSLEGELKKTKEDLVSLNATLTEEYKSITEVAVIGMAEVTSSHAKRDKAQGKLGDLHNVA